MGDMNQMPLMTSMIKKECDKLESRIDGAWKTQYEKWERDQQGGMMIFVGEVTFNITGYDENESNNRKQLFLKASVLSMDKPKVRESHVLADNLWFAKEHAEKDQYGCLEVDVRNCWKMGGGGKLKVTGE